MVQALTVLLLCEALSHSWVQDHWSCNVSGARGEGQQQKQAGPFAAGACRRMSKEAVLRSQTQVVKEWMGVGLSCLWGVKGVQGAVQVSMGSQSGRRYKGWPGTVWGRQDDRRQAPVMPVVGSCWSRQQVGMR